MFANPYPSRGPSRPFHCSVYEQVGVETRLAGATPHRLVTMLFDGLADALAQARGAIRDGRQEVKGEAIGRAVRIIDEGLRAGLDLRAGGALAQDLHALYGYVTMRLTVANLRNDVAAIEECQRLVQPLREAWSAIADQAAA